MAERPTERTVDFSNVKESSGINTKRLPAGDYLAKIVECRDGEVKSGENKGTFQYTWVLAPVDHPSRRYPFRTPFVENQLWKLRNLLVAGGHPVPQRRLKVQPNRVLGRTVGITLEDDEYEGRENSQIVAIFAATELASQSVPADPDDDEDAPYTGPAVDDDGDDDEDEVVVDEDSGDEFDGMDRNELKRFIKSKDDAAKFLKSESDDDLRTRARALSSDEEEDEEDEPAPPPKKAAAKKAATKKATPKPPVDDDDDDLDTLDLDDDL